MDAIRVLPLLFHRRGECRFHASPVSWDEISGPDEPDGAALEKSRAWARIRCVHGRDDKPLTYRGASAAVMEHVSQEEESCSIRPRVAAIFRRLAACPRNIRPELWRQWTAMPPVPAAY